MNKLLILMLTALFLLGCGGSTGTYREVENSGCRKILEYFMDCDTELCFARSSSRSSHAGFGCLAHVPCDKVPDWMMSNHFSTEE